MEKNIHKKTGKGARTFWAVGAIGLTIAGVVLWEKLNEDMASTVTYKAEALEMKALPVVVQPDRLDKKIAQMKGEVLDTLAKCESGGLKETDGIAILDSNAKGSYGPYQFQRKTVMHFYPLMTGEQINGRDAIIFALQGEKARILAEYIIFETKNGVASDWVNCSRKFGLQTKVDLIKSLEN